MKDIRPLPLMTFLIIAIFVVAATVPSCQVGVVDESIDRVRSAGKIVVAVDPSYPPLAAIDGKGQPDGYEIELASEIGNRLGVTADFVSIDVGGVIDALVARKIDVIISGISPDPDLSKQVVFSRPYFNDGQVLIVPDGKPRSISEMAGLTLGVESGSAGDILARKIAQQVQGLRLKSYTTPDAAIEDVRAGGVDAAMTDVITAQQLGGHIPGLTVVFPPLSNEFYAVVAKRDDQKLIDEVSKIIDTLDREGYLARLADHWIR